MALNFDRTLAVTLTGNGQERILQELKCVFEIKKSIQSYPNIVKIDIYNTLESTRKLATFKDSKIDILVGYNANNRLIFSGDVRNSFQSRQGTDHITTIYAGDGTRAFEKARINKTYSEKTSLKQIVTDLFATFPKIAQGEIAGLVDGFKDALTPRTLSGSSKTFLDQLAKSHGFNWKINDNKIEVIPIDQDKQREATLVRADTGLIGTPVVTKAGVEVKLAMNPSIQPNELIEVESVGSIINLPAVQYTRVNRTEAEGIYKVYEVIHKGDTHGDEWTTTVKGVQFDRVSQ